MLRSAVLILAVQCVCCRDILVPLGREVLLSPSDTSVTDTGSWCIVEVSEEDPLSSGIGELTPRTFRCNFTHGQVKYNHFGSPYWKKQAIRLLVYNLYENTTHVKRLSLHVTVKDGPYSQFVRPHQSLKVHAPLGLSAPVDSSVLALPVREGIDCKIHFLSSYRWPAYGHLVVGSQLKPVESMTRSCQDFVGINVRYEHTKAQSPNVDFVQLLVEIKDEDQRSKLSEWVQVPVEIEQSHPNEPPQLPSEQIIELPKNRIPVPFEILGAEDRESDRITFNITRYPSHGDIVCLKFLLPCSSFNSQHSIAYMPRGNGSSTEPDVAEVVALDDFFQPSRRLQLHFSHTSVENTSRASTSAVLSGLFILEGQSRRITDANLLLPDQAKIFLTGGLFHGKIEVAGRVASYFTANDVLSGRVSYAHDDSDSTVDSVHLLVTDPSQDEDYETTLLLPVKILPKDDQAPMLVANRELAVIEMQHVSLGPQILSARDPDSPRHEIRYQVTSIPRNGVLVRKLPVSWDLHPDTQIRSFTQEEVDEGVILYLHQQNGTFSDSFEVVLKDSSIPPNRSPPAIILVTVVLPGPPPIPDPDSSFYLITPETEMHALTRAHINFVDVNSSPADLLYSLVEPPRLVDGFGMSRTPPGWLADPAHPLTPLASFTQDQVDRRQVTYCAGAEDVGYYSQKVVFNMTLRDRVGRIVSGVVFNVSVLPVNNQAPTFHTGTLLLDEGTTAVITVAALRAHDDDTLLTGLQISVLTVPLHGSLNRNGFVLRVGDLLSPEDILAHRLEYKHDGSENFADAFSMGINDGVNFATGHVNVQIRPVDDEPPRWLPGLIKKILVEEGSQVVLTSEVLAATDLDTDNNLLHFILTEGPRYGDVIVDGKPSTRCTQADVVKGKVVYRTKETEIGAHSLHDSMTWVVSDRALPSARPHQPRIVGILVLSHNNQAPQVVVKETLKVVEGGRAVVDVLAAWDEDSDPQELMFHVTHEPQHGFLENVRPPHPGSTVPVTGLGRKVLAFSERDLADGLVSYVQDQHSGTEPTWDEVGLYVSDGQFNSSEVRLRIEIAGVNDEAPVIEARNLTVDEGGLLPIGEGLISVRDPDLPPDPLVVTVTARPLHGSLVRLVEGNGQTVETPFTTVDAEQFYGHVGYRHDGSENFEDWFVLNVTDGLHATACNVSTIVSPVNDEPPFLARNLGIVLPDANVSVAITAEELLVEDKDTPPEEILCTLTVLPSMGSIETARDDGIENMTGSFTQTDITESKVRYVVGNGTTNAEDKFYLVCSDGIQNTSEAEFRVWLWPRLTVTPMGAVVQVGKKVSIDPHTLSTNEVPYPPTAVLFDVTQMPHSGRLELGTSPGTPVSSFTMADVLLRRLSYRHGGEESGSDRFDFVACIPSGSCADGTFLVTVQPAARPEMPPTLHVLLPLRVLSDGPKTVTSQQLYARDVLAPPGNVTFEVLKKPEHGVLLLDGVQLASETFSQEDVNRGLLAYRRLESSSHPSDHFLFRVSNGRVPGFLYRGLRRIKPVKFEILLVNVIGSIPIVTFHETSAAFHQLPDGNWGLPLRGFVRSRDVGSNSSQLLYLVAESPEKGKLVPCSSSPSPALFSFTESELENGHVCYVPNDGNVVKDGFSFKVQNKEGRMVGPYRLDLEWTAVVPLVPEVFLCENEGTIKAGFRRIGDPSKAVSAITRIIAASGTRPVKLNRGLDFDAGAAQSTWMADIIGNTTGLAVQQFVIEVTRLQNGILNSPVPLLVTLLGSDTDVCSNATGEPILRQTLEDSGLINASDCTSTTQMPLRYDEATEQLQKCTKNAWVPWKRNRPQIQRGTSSDGGTKCLKGWQPWQDQCYRWFRKGSTWAVAKARCRALEADLVSVLSAHHRTWLVKLAHERPFWILADTSDLRASLHSHPCPLQRGVHRPLRKHCGQIHGFVCAARTLQK